MYELIIIGGGPAGTSAAVYAARKQLKTLLITKDFGGQSINSIGIENWIGEIKISGFELAQKLEKHANAFIGEYLEIKKNEEVLKIEKTGETFTVSTKNGDYNTKTVLITSGSNRRKLPAINADKFEHKGLTYCATCDGPMFQNKIVAVVGGGNSAIESTMQLLSYAEKVYLIHRKDSFRADPISVEAIKNNPKLEIVYNSEITEILGETMVNGLKLKNIKDGAEKQLAVDGIFVEIGAVPTVGFLNDLVELSDEKTIKIDPWTQKTSVPGIWAAGDVTNIKYHQNNIAAGNAVTAIEDIFGYIKSGK
jgi:thioredoxin reductase (NADPH)